MKLLDLFCGAGGAAEGYRRAGFTEIVGIDIKPQPHYPFEFIQADSLRPPLDLSRFDLIHASPPCQAYCALKTMTNAREHVELIEPVRQMLRSSGVNYVIENVFGAPLNTMLMLCGSFFGLQSNEFQLRRHRYFESNIFMLTNFHCNHAPKTLGVYGSKVRNIAQEKRHYAKNKTTRGEPIGVVLPQQYGFAAMDVDWMNIDELSEAIPPAYTEWIGRQIISQEVLSFEAVA